MLILLMLLILFKYDLINLQKADGQNSQVKHVKYTITTVLKYCEILRWKIAHHTFASCHNIRICASTLSKDTYMDISVKPFLPPDIQFYLMK